MCDILIVVKSLDYTVLLSQIGATFESVKLCRLFEELSTLLCWFTYEFHLL